MSAPARLLSLDLDGTLLGRPEATARFQQTWHALAAGTRPLLVYNTSRTIADTRAFIASGRLCEPDYIIGSMGTDLHSNLYDVSTQFRTQLGHGWNLTRVEEILAAIPRVRKQPAEFLNEFKSSWFWDGATHQEISGLTAKLRSLGLEVSLVYSCQHFLDIIPRRAGKGNALAWICARLGIPLSQVIVAGDTANDCDMFRLPDVRGILVGNALSELRTTCHPERTFVASLEMADGVLQGLRHFRIIADSASPHRVY